MSNQIETWEPDWEAIARAYMSAPPSASLGLKAIIAEYQRQQAGLGRVEVDLEDLRTAQAALRAAPKLAEEALAHFDAILSVTKEQP